MGRREMLLRSALACCIPAAAALTQGDAAFSHAGFVTGGAGLRPAAPAIKMHVEPHSAGSGFVAACNGVARCWRTTACSLLPLGSGKRLTRSTTDVPAADGRAAEHDVGAVVIQGFQEHVAPLLAVLAAAMVAVCRAISVHVATGKAAVTAAVHQRTRAMAAFAFVVLAHAQSAMSVLARRAVAPLPRTPAEQLRELIAPTSAHAREQAVARVSQTQASSASPDATLVMATGALIARQLVAPARPAAWTTSSIASTSVACLAQAKQHFIDTVQRSAGELVSEAPGNDGALREQRRAAAALKKEQAFQRKVAAKTERFRRERQVQHVMRVIREAAPLQSRVPAPAVESGSESVGQEVKEDEAGRKKSWKAYPAYDPQCRRGFGQTAVSMRSQRALEEAGGKEPAPATTTQEDERESAARLSRAASVVNMGTHRAKARQGGGWKAELQARAAAIRKEYQAPAPRHEPEALAGESEHKRSSWQPPAGYDPHDRRGRGQTAVSLRALRAAEEQRAAQEAAEAAPSQTAGGADRELAPSANNIVQGRPARASRARGVPVSPVDEGECANNIVRYEDVSGGQYRYEVPARLAEDDPKILAMKRQLARLRGESA